MNEGWIKIYYKIKEWEWYGDPNMVALWIHLLISANWKDKKWHGVDIKRGQFITSVSKLAEATGLTTRQTRVCLERLQESKQIVKQTTSHYTIITICNYNNYQDCEQTECQTNDKQNVTPMTNQWQADDKQSVTQMTTTKDYKEGKEREERKNILIPSPNARAREIGIEKLGSFSNVFLFPAEQRHLVETYGQELTDKAVDDLSCKLAEGDEQALNSRNHYATLDRWLRYKIEKSAKAPMSNNPSTTETEEQKCRRIWAMMKKEDQEQHLKDNDGLYPWEDPRYNKSLIQQDYGNAK